MTPLLSHERATGEPPPSRWVLFLHGIFGRGRNWASFARRLAAARPEWGGVLVDLRLHGSSRDLPPPHTLEACARDVIGLAESLGAAGLALLGHSFGGKVALLAAAAGLPGLCQTWIVDATPAAGPRRGSAAAMLDALRALPADFPDRTAAVEALAGRGFPRQVAEWMATNLEPGDGSLVWRFDLDALEGLLSDFHRADLWAAVEKPPGALPLHFVKAQGSDVLDEESCARILAVAASGAPVHLHRVEGGHWVNVDNPDALLRLLAERLP